MSDPQAPVYTDEGRDALFDEAEEAFQNAAEGDDDTGGDDDVD